MTSLDPARLARAEQLHYRMLEELYCPRSEDLGDGRWCHSPEIDDPEWNHAGLIRTTEARLGDLLERICQIAAGHRRRPVVAVSPFTEPPGLSAELARRGWTVAYRHRWLFHAGVAVPAPDPPSGTRISEVASREQMEDFCRVFYQAFGEHVELSPGYAATLRGSVDAASVRHYLATADGTPAAVGTAVRCEDAVGLYNLGVAPAFRRRGLGSAVNARRISDALAAGARQIFFQVEDAAVQRWQQRRGLRLGFEVAGWVAALPR